MTFIENRTPGKPGSPGPYIAEVVNNFDPSYMGGLEVVVYKNNSPPSKIDESVAVPVKYLSPFYSVTSPRFEGNNSSDFNDVQKSHGMWMVPPDIGAKVLVIFVQGDINQGFWIGCIPDEFQNHMIPGIAASKVSQITQEQYRRYGTNNLPVAEFLKKTLDTGVCRDPNLIPKAIHPFADRLLAQGLLLDTVRGTTTSSARREAPSRVFGISTPGPKDTSPGAKKGMLGYEQNKPSFVSRLGGSTFVMDDGDGDGNNELVRIRTRTGHQILLHNSHDLIYIANSKGTAWIELTSNGKIDIFAQDSVSIHTETDFNFRADRDINLEAGRNFNVSTGNDFNLNVKTDYNLIVGRTGKLEFNGAYNHTAKGAIKFNTTLDFNLTANGSINQTAKGDLSLVSDGSNFFTTQGNTNIFSKLNHVETAEKIFMNGPTAAQGAVAEMPETPEQLKRYFLPNIKTTAGWSDGNFYKAENISSIMLRVPTHEPWPDHENIDSATFSRTALDSSAGHTKKSTAPHRSQVPLNPNQPADWREDKEFISKVKSVAKEFKVKPEELLAVMAFESGGTMNPNQPNLAGSGAVGLIQFMPFTAARLGTTSEYLAGLTRTDQLDWVAKYFNLWNLKRYANLNLGDLYMSVLWPAAIGQPDSYVLFSAGSLEYSLNALDGGKDGAVTKGLATQKVAEYLPPMKKILANFDKENA